MHCQRVPACRLRSRLCCVRGPPPPLQLVWRRRVCGSGPVASSGPAPEAGLCAAASRAELVAWEDRRDSLVEVGREACCKGSVWGIQEWEGGIWALVFEGYTNVAAFCSSGVWLKNPKHLHPSCQWPDRLHADKLGCKKLMGITFGRYTWSCVVSQSCTPALCFHTSISRRNTVLEAALCPGTRVVYELAMGSSSIRTFWFLPAPSPHPSTYLNFFTIFNGSSTGHEYLHFPRSWPFGHVFAFFFRPGLVKT